MMNSKAPIDFDLETKKNVDMWLKGPFDEEVKFQIRKLLTEDPKQLIDAFYTHLTFGTAGLRGLIGFGTNRINFYTIRAATQGLVNYIHKLPHEADRKYSICIGYDSRQNSREFAEEAAKVLAGNQMSVYLFKELRPTPLVSFACRYKHCIAAIMITASHNPPAYNGYKVYWADGGQIVPPHDLGIIAEVVKVNDPTMVKSASSVSHPLIHQVENEIDDAYLQAIATLQNYPEMNRKEGDRLKIVYTNLHGTGITLVPKALEAWGFSKIHFVEPQIIPDGRFPTVKSPDPEEPAALKMGIDLLLETKSDLLIATDPDADRMGVVIRHLNQPVILNGNQIFAICAAHICAALSAQKRFPKQAAIIKTIGTTELVQDICRTYHCSCFNVLPGFKYIAQKIHEWETLPNGYQYIFGGEESNGYLLGTFARDKDGVVSSALISEIALQSKLEGKTLADKLFDLYNQYGVYQEKLLSLHFAETKEGKEQMSAGMRLLREARLHHINGIPVVSVEDFLVSTKYWLGSNKTELLLLPVSDVLLYWLEDGTKVMIRPSGTEPKIKLYCSAVEKKFANIPDGIASCMRRCESILQFLKQQCFS